MSKLLLYSNIEMDKVGITLKKSNKKVNINLPTSNTKLLKSKPLLYFCSCLKMNSVLKNQCTQKSVPQSF